MTPLDRASFPVTEAWTYLNHAGVAPLPRQSAAAMQAYAGVAAADGGETWQRHEAREAQVRLAGARVMGVDVADVAFIANTTVGLGLVAGGFDWKPGDRVVVPTCEFPSNLYPWLALGDQGVEVVRIEPEGPGDRLDSALFEAALRRGGVRVVAVSWVQFGRGWRLDLEALGRMCREHDSLLVVDAIQALGVIPAEFERWEVDVAAADGHKWMLGPEGLGVLYANERARDRLRVVAPGWNSVVHRQQWDNRDLVLDPTARRFEPGTMNYAGIYGLGASLDLLLEAGVAAVWAHVDGLCTRLAEGLEAADAHVLTDRSEGGGSGIVTFRLPGEAPEETEARLLARRFSVRARGGGVRVAPHGYNTVEEIDALVEALRP